VGEAVLSRLRLALAAALAVASPVAAETATETVGRVVVRSPVELDREEVEPLIAVRPGEPLSSDRVRRTLRNLSVSGLAAEVELWTRPAAGGVEVIVVIRPEVRVTAVELLGELPLDAGRLRAALPQQAGQPLREDRVLRGIYRLEEELAAEGWLDARVRIEVDVDDRARRAEVRYRIAPGVRTTIGSVGVRGLGERVPAAEALESLRARAGRPYLRAAVREDTERLERYLYDRGYRAAQVGDVVEERRGELVDLYWPVELGPRVALEVTGVERAELERRDLLPLQGDAGLDEALLIQSAAEIRRHYQERGHYRVTVEYEQIESDGLLTVRFEVEPGPRFRLESVRFVGDPLSYSPERLERLLSTRPRRLLAPGSGRLVDSELSEDLANLRSFYALEGFVGARIGPAQVEQAGEVLVVAIPIVEGHRRTVVGVEIVGLAAELAAELRERLPLAAGSPFHPFHVDTGSEVLRTALDERGYRAAIVVPTIDWDESGREAVVRYRILEGERSTAESIVVHGNVRTDGELVRRFLALEPGQPISLAALLDAQRGLYRLGAFSRVEVRAPIYEGEFASQQVVVELEEGRTRSLLLGAGYDSDRGARGLVRLSESNLAGRLTTVQLDALIAQREQDYRLLARQPYFFRWPVEARALAYLEQEDRSSFDVRRRGVGFGLTRAWDELRVGLFANYRLVEEDLEQFDPSIPRESQDARVASLTASLLYDRRDDPVDPTRGWSAALDLERATPLLDADADFSKLFGQLTGVLPIGKLGVLAGSARAGVVLPRTLTGSDEAIDEVPVSELFYGGGRTTHRAYRRDELGILGETLVLDEDGSPLALGGGFVALVNFDWRFPIAGSFGGELFVDGGNVWREADDFEVADVRWGAGVGLRYDSPLGPLRAEIGWNLEPELYEDDFVVSISLGNAF
jgi:outer membrane protein insertion porin family/translocation and assembly module TamA